MLSSPATALDYKKPLGSAVVLLKPLRGYLTVLSFLKCFRLQRHLTKSNPCILKVFLAALTGVV